MDNPEFLWQQLGWKKSSDGKNRKKFAGDYLPNSPHKCRGTILEDSRTTPSTIRAFIHEPPPSLSRHPHGSCFSLIDNGWFGVHWETAPTTVDDALVYMTTVLQWCLANS